MSGHACALVGAQYGSEGKGAIVAILANEYDVHVRTGGPNAGHTFYLNNEPHVMQSLPCGWANPNARLVIGAGATVDVGQLLLEIERAEKVMPGVSKRVVVDPNASILSEDNYAEEGGVNGELHSRIGSTGKGVGACRLDRIRRNEQKHTICRNDSRLKPFLGDTAFLIRDALASGTNVMLEGTQGSGLSLVHGPWPYVTTGDTNAAQLAADAGVPPAKVSRVVLVARTFPIRVAGNSGPMVNEISWPELSNRIGRTVEERTTVTKKVRRVSEWDDAVFSRAVAVNGPTEIALTFADYIGDGSCRNVNRWEEITPEVKNFVAKVESDHKVNIRWVATGPKPEDVVDRNR